MGRTVGGRNLHSLHPAGTPSLAQFPAVDTDLMRILMFIVFVSLVAAGPTGATVVDETAIDVQTREIAKTLRCTVCQTENLWESGAPLAHQMREVIRERLRQGQTPEEIRAYFLSRYGEYILMEPPKRGINWFIWIGPFLLLSLGGYLLYRELRRWVTPPPSEEGHPPPLDEASQKRIEQELRSRV
ncbi:MAG: cytochrome c-type biogenesis protein CcmH [Nitrospirae bacterium]|nr:MAG: cytochrome c-type biogenesis protein CcmH [Nitrospirota bacterium]